LLLVADRRLMLLSYHGVILEGVLNDGEHRTDGRGAWVEVDMCCDEQMISTLKAKGKGWDLLGVPARVS